MADKFFSVFNFTFHRASLDQEFLTPKVGTFNLGKNDLTIWALDLIALTADLLKIQFFGAFYALNGRDILMTIDIWANYIITIGQNFLTVINVLIAVKANYNMEGFLTFKAGNRG